MGWKSTIDVTREEALAMIREVDLEELDDALLAEILEAVLGGENHGHNYRIVS
jgi:hypothetical protein